MIDLDTSVALAHLLAEDRRPPDELATYDDRLLAAARALDFPIATV